MRKTYVLLASVLILTILVSGCTSKQEEPLGSDGVSDGGDSASNEQACLDAGGEWKEFSDTCVDDCAYVRNPEVMVCGEALTFGCECGPDACWNGSGCEPV